MAKSGQHNQDKSVFGKKLTKLRNTQNFKSFASFFGVSEATLSRYVSGAATPSMQQLWDFILRYAADHNMQMIDLNWLMNDNDRRPGPVFVNENAQVGAGAMSVDVNGTDEAGPFGKSEKQVAMLINGIQQTLSDYFFQVQNGQFSAQNFLKVIDSIGEIIQEKLLSEQARVENTQSSMDDQQEEELVS